MPQSRVWRLLAGSVFVALVISGCGKRAGPTLVGGKPISVWVESLRSPDARVRQKAVDKLGNVGTADPQAFPAVVGALTDTDPAVRQAAIRALPKFGSKARDAVTDLSKIASDDPDAGLRSEAASAIQVIQNAPKGK